MRPGWNPRNANNHYQNRGFDFSNFMSQLPNAFENLGNAMGDFTQNASSWLGNNHNSRASQNQQANWESNPWLNPQHIFNQPGRGSQTPQSNREGGSQRSHAPTNSGPQRSQGSGPYNPFEERQNSYQNGRNPFMDEEPISNHQSNTANGRNPNASRQNLQPNTGRTNTLPQQAPANDLADRMGERIKANNAKEPIRNNFFGGAKPSNSAGQNENTGSGGLLDGRMGERIKPNSGTTFGSTSSRSYLTTSWWRQT